MKLLVSIAIAAVGIAIIVHRMNRSLALRRDAGERRKYARRKQPWE